MIICNKTSNKIMIRLRLSSNRLGAQRPQMYSAMEHTGNKIPNDTLKPSFSFIVEIRMSNNVETMITPELSKQLNVG